MSWYRDSDGKIITNEEFHNDCFECLNFCQKGTVSVPCNGERTDCTYFREVDTSDYDKKIRDKAIEGLKELVEGHKYVNAEDGTTIEEMLKNEETEKKYAWYLSRNQCCDWMLHRLDEIAEQMKEVGE